MTIIKIPCNPQELEKKYIYIATLMMYLIKLNNKIIFIDSNKNIPQEEILETYVLLREIKECGKLSGIWHVSNHWITKRLPKLQDIDPALRVNKNIVVPSRKDIQIRYPIVSKGMNIANNLNSVLLNILSEPDIKIKTLEEGLTVLSDFNMAHRLYGIGIAVDDWLNELINSKG